MTDNLPALLGTPTSFDLVPVAHTLAKQIASTDFVPKSLRGKPEAVLACILTGHELGIGPMQALAKIHVIEGRPAMSAELMRAVVLAAGHDLWIDESTTTRCVMGAQRVGASRPSSATFTMDDARSAGLAGKAVWRAYPRAMLLARCTAELCRGIFADVLAGISYTVEELQDGDFLDLEDVKAPALATPETPAAKVRASKKATAPRQPKVASAPAPTTRQAERAPLPGEEGADVTAGPRLSGPSVIAIRCGEHGLDDRGDRLAFVGAVLGHVVDTTKDLAPADITKVLEALDDDGKRRAALEYAGLPVDADIEEDDPDDGAPDDVDETDDAGAPDEAEIPASGEAWRVFLKAHGRRVVDALRFAEVGSLNELTGDAASKLYAWTLEAGS